MNEGRIDVAKEFTNRPFGRYRNDDSERSAEVFRDDILIPAMGKCDHIVVDLSGSNYYGSSFLEEVFGGLVRSGFKKEELNKKLEIIHTVLPSVVMEANEYIKEASKAEC